MANACHPVINTFDFRQLDVIILLKIDQIILSAFGATIAFR